MRRSQENQRVIGLTRRFGAAVTQSEPRIVALRIDVRSVRGAFMMNKKVLLTGVK